MFIVFWTFQFFLEGGGDGQDLTLEVQDQVMSRGKFIFPFYFNFVC